LEVERKFLPTAESIARLRANLDQPRFRNICELGTCKIHEIYYDRNDWLSSQGIYVRLRNGKWEAKVRKGGDYTNSRFEEYDDVEEIRSVVREALDKTGGYADTWQMGLSPMAEFKTQRESWDVNGFRVVIDEADFGYTVGEVELCQSLGDNTGPAMPTNGLELEQTGLELDSRIETFMKEFEWAFPNGKVMGKLSAYF
ncbi:uncharacterized protein BDR25DRAFT_203655, partial [Lindgomyces ingoldianus]